MLTVLLSTARAPRSYAHHPEWNHFDQLARHLSEQTFRDFELVVVTPFVEEARQALDGRVDRLVVVQPRDTPWRRERMFAVSSARNTGLVHARGDTVLVIDDCFEFETDFFACVARWAQKGFAVAVMDCKADGAKNDSRWPIFEARARGKESIILRRKDDLTPQGCMAFPLDAAIAINGYDERFDGARGLEDMNFPRRLMLRGVPFVMDRSITIRRHDHIGYPEEIIANENQNARCCNPTHVLAQMGEANRVRYTADEKDKILHCMFWRDDGKCGYYNHASDCAYPTWAKSGHPVALRIMLGDEEELFDLAAARRDAQRS